MSDPDKYEEGQCDISSDGLLGSTDDNDLEETYIESIQHLLNDENGENDKASSGDLNNDLNNDNNDAPADTGVDAGPSCSDPSVISPTPSCSGTGVTSYSKRSRNNLDETEVITRRNSKTKRMYYFAIDENKENDKFVANLNTVLEDLRNMRLNLEDLRTRIFSAEMDNIIGEIKSLVSSIRASITLYNYYIDSTPQTFYNEMTATYESKFLNIYNRYVNVQDSMVDLKYHSDDSDTGEINCNDNIIIENVPSDFDAEPTEDHSKDADDTLVDKNSENEDNNGN